MAEEQAAHRRAIESRVIAGNVDAERRGQVFAFALTLFAIISPSLTRSPVILPI